MTTYGWDASNYDDPITIRDGIDFYTHKAAEGHHMYYDREYLQSMANALALGIPVLGAYFVNHPGTVSDQVDWFIQILDQDTPWWRTHPCFVLQIDAEKFGYMPSAPTKAEIQAFGDRLVNVHGVDPRRIIAYAPQWLYGNTLAGLTYRLWASAYGTNPFTHYLAAYPGDGSVRWQSYSGQSPLILQYGSNTTIGNQTTCDANAFRGTLIELMTALGANSEPPQMPNKEDDVVTYILQQDGVGIVLAWPDSKAKKWVYTNIVPPTGDIPNVPEFVGRLQAAGCVGPIAAKFKNNPMYVELADVPDQSITVGDVSVEVGDLNFVGKITKAV